MVRQLISADLSLRHTHRLSRTDNTLYQGCRSASKDQHYKDDFTALATEENKGGNKLVYRVACSRDGPPGFGRTYVQHLIREDAERIWDIVGTRKGFVYISGYVESLILPKRVSSSHG